MQKMSLYNTDRVEICRDRHDQQLRKIGASCVNFSRKQRNFLHNLHRTTRFTPAKCDFALKLKILHTQLNFNKKSTQITDINALTLFLFSKNSRNLRTFSV